MKLSDYIFSGIEVISEGFFDILRLQLGELSEYNSLVFALNDEYFKNAYEDEHVSAIICSRSENIKIPANPSKGIAVSDNPKLSFYSIHNYLAANDKNYIGYKGLNSEIGKDTIIHPSAIISPIDVKIGERCRIEENVIIRQGTVIGNDVVIRAGTIIGVVNDLNIPDENGDLIPIAAIGNVVIGNNCDVGYYVTIAKGWMSGETTEIGDHVFLGSKATIGHNVKIGRNTDIIDCSQVCGYTVIGEGSHIAPQSVISNNLNIGKQTYVTIGSTVINNLKDNSTVAGNFAIDKNKFLKWHLKKLRK